jgi:hypothetical protein
MFPFALKIFHTAGCGRLSRLFDELAMLGLDSGPRRLPDAKIRAKGNYRGGQPKDSHWSAQGQKGDAKKPLTQRAFS